MLFVRLKSLTPGQAAASLGEGRLQLIDVREPREVAETRVPGAINIPLGQLGARLPELDPSRQCAFLCRSGRRSAIAARMAAKAGLDAANVRGGLMRWTKAGLPVTDRRAAQ